MTDAAHILVVDDDREIRSLLRDFLEKNGLRATAVGDGAEARRALAQGRVDLIVLDLMLPHESGLAICRELRATSTIPIIMLTALGEEVDRVVGLEVGADDYLSKPFSPRELLGRIRAVLRRTLQAARPEDAESSRAYRFAGWRLDTTTRGLTDAAGANVPLGGAEYRLLVTLLARAPKVVQISMGHSSIQMTLDVYGHLLPGDHATAAGALSRAFGAAAVAKGSGNFLGTSGEKAQEIGAAAEAGG